MRKVQLIIPGLDEEYKCAEKYLPVITPASLCYLAGNIDKNAWQVEIYDGRIVPQEIILSSLDGEVVGVSSFFTNHKRALEYLKAAKQRGAITVMGGVNASPLADKVLRNNGYVDYVFCGEAEKSFALFLEQIAEGSNPYSIPGLVYRTQNGLIRRNPRQQISDLDSVPIIGLEEVINREEYLELLRSRGYFGIASIRGCQKAMEKGRCSFCSITTTGLRMVSPKRYYDQIRFAVEKYGTRNFFDSADDFAVPEFLEALVENKPHDLEFNIYTQIGLERITSDAAQKMRQIGVNTVLVGLETFDDDVMERANKKRKNVEQQIEYLANAGIAVRLNVLYGLAGESNQSIAYTHERLNRLLIESGSRDKLSIRPKMVFPTPGSALFRDCLRNEGLVREYNERTGQDLRTEDKIDHLLLQELYVKHFTSLTVEAIAQMIQEQKERLPIEARPLYL